MKDYYRILGVKPDAPSDVIDAVYERLLNWQDKYGAYSEQRLQDIDEAYDVLSDPDARAAYDKTLPYVPAKTVIPLSEPLPTKRPPKRLNQPAKQSNIPRPLTPEERQSAYESTVKMFRFQRAAAAILATLFFLVLRICYNTADSADWFSSSKPIGFPTRVINPPTSVPYERKTDELMAQAKVSGSCVGIITHSTFGYASNRQSTVRYIVRDTYLNFWPEDGSEWYRLEDGYFGIYIPAENVKIIICPSSLEGQLQE